MRFQGGPALTEVAASPAQGQYWPDYRTSGHGDGNWNTGTLLFNPADAGKTVLATYSGTGTLTDERLLDQAEISVTSSVQPERDVITGEPSSYDAEITTGEKGSFRTLKGTRGRLKTHRGVKAGTYTLRAILQQLVNLSHTQEYQKETYYYDCNCSNCDCGDDNAP